MTGNFTDAWWNYEWIEQREEFIIGSDKVIFYEATYCGCGIRLGIKQCIPAAVCTLTAAVPLFTPLEIQKMHMDEKIRRVAKKEKAH